MARIHAVFESGEPSRTIDFDPREAPFQHDGQPASVLDILLGHGVSLEHACGFSCSCTTFHVVFTHGATFLPPAKENA